MNTLPTRSGRGRSSCRARGKCWPASSTRARTSGSARGLHATPSSNSSSDSRQRARKSGTRVVSTDVHSGTDRAIGPAWSKLGASGKQPSSGTRPWLGLKPTTPHHAAGIRIEPPESVPRAASASPAASAAAEPPLEPPARRPGATGFGTVPKCGFCDEIPYANSWRFVLPTVAYPAASSRATDSAVRSGRCSANTIEPYVVTSPAVSNRSLTASGIPSAGRSGRARKIDTPVIIRRRPDRGSVPGPTCFRRTPPRARPRSPPRRLRSACRPPTACPSDRRRRRSGSAHDRTRRYQLDEPRRCGPAPNGLLVARRAEAI
jgi:hypothetical protein